MKNVYDIKKQKKLLWTLPSDVKSEECVEENILIVVHFHYLECVDYYLNYLRRIRGNIRIVISTSNVELKEYLEQVRDTFLVPVKIISKENRGRDISALLVSMREEILQSEYVCFVHDKKEKSELMRDDNNKFVECLWENLLSSTEYIHNVLGVFRNNSNVGVLLPPEAYTKHLCFVQKNTWDKDYALMKTLSERLTLKCNLDENKKPLSVGTAFWARTCALKKLFLYEWKYTDFDEEPLANDGTVSHAIERCFPYVAQDAGFDTGIVMTQKYAADRFFQYEETIMDLFQLARVMFNIDSLAQLSWANTLIKNMDSIEESFQSIYVYGAGAYAKRVVNILRALEKDIAGVIVTKLENQNTIFDLPIYSLEEHIRADNQIVIVATSDIYQDDIVLNLKKHGFKDNQIVRSSVF